MNVAQWQKIADLIQGACARLSRTLMVGHICSIVFLLVGFLIPDFPINQIFVLQFTMLCISLATVGSIAAVNYMFTLFAIQQIGKSK